MANEMAGEFLTRPAALSIKGCHLMISHEIPHDMLLAATASAIRVKLAKGPMLSRFDIAITDGTIVLKGVAANASSACDTHQIVRALAHDLPVRSLVLISSRDDQC